MHYATAIGEVESVLRKAGGVICQEPLTEVSLKPRPATVPSPHAEKPSPPLHHI